MINKEYEYWDLFSDVPKTEKLTDEMGKKGINFPLNTIENRWCAYAIYDLEQSGISNLIEQSSFGSIISLFFGGKAVSASTEYYIKEETIENQCVDMWNLIDDTLSTKERLKEFYNKIKELYTSNINEYWRNTERINLRVSMKTFQRFEAVEGKTYNEKLVNLLQRWEDD